jgi:hypothetical protein
MEEGVRQFALMGLEANITVVQLFSFKLTFKHE